MKKVLLTTIIIFIRLTSPAQDWEWVQSFPSEMSGAAFDVAVDPWGNSLMLCAFEDTIQFNNTTFTSTDWGPDMLCIKRDSSGNILWVNQLECGNTSFNPTNSPSLTTDHLGNVYIVSFFSETMPLGNYTLISYNYPCQRCPDPCYDPVYGCDCAYDTVTCYNWDTYIAKFNPQGNFKWVKQFSNASFVRVFDIAVDQDLNIFLTGNFRDTVYFDSLMLTETLSPNHRSRDDFFLLKMDSSQQVVWASSGGSSHRDADFGAGLAVDCEGNAYISGMVRDTAYFGEVVLPEAGGFAAKYDPEGNIMWTTHLDSAALAIAIDVDPDGNSYVGGAYTSMFLSKLDSLGNVIWKRTPSSGSISNNLWDLKVDDLGNTFFTGFIKAPTQFDTLSLYAGSIEAFVASYNTDGRVQWVREAEGTGSVQGWNIELSPNNAIMLMGIFQFRAHFWPHQVVAVGELGAMDVFLTRIKAPVALQTAGCPDIALAFEETFETSLPFSIYPNPSSGSFTVDLQQEYVDVSLSVSNMTGQRVFQSTYTLAREMEVKVDGPRGLYLVEVHTGKGISEILKVLIE